jgi:DNA-binding NtrC family response regulator
MLSRALKVLIVDDEPSVRHALAVLFDVHGLPHVQAGSPEEALARIESGEIGVVLQDMNFGPDKTSGEQGIRLFHRIRAVDPQVPVLLMTAWASLEAAVRLIKEGADDYLSKPWDDDKLVVTVNNLLRLRRLQLENDELQHGRRQARDELAAKHDLCGLVYESDAMHRVVTLALHVAASEASVLITGPSGVGKEKLAEIVQANSRRRGAAFIRVNVGALPHELLEAELFGAEPGAYTGATARRVGRFEAADSGTLFLDEIDALPLAGQVKLLRVVQSGEFQRLGSSRTLRADVRIVSATNTDLGRAVAEGRFREDLYYRLNVIELAVPPLAERPEDILPLARHFLTEALGGEATAHLGVEAEAVLIHHEWKGQVRELQNRSRRAALTCGTGEILPTHLDLGPELDTQQAAFGGLPDSERTRIERALVEADGIVAHAADRLGLSRQALYRKMERLGIVLERRPR